MLNEPLSYTHRTRAFLEKLGLNTWVSPPRPPEAETILMDKSVTQPAPDIRRKLQKLAVGPEGTREELPQAADRVDYNRDREENQEHERKL